MANEKCLKVTLIKSVNGCLQDQKATVAALGLHKIGQTVEKPDNACVRGQLFKVRHLVKVQED